MSIKVANWSTTPASNTSVDGVAIGENCPFANMNNMGRAIMSAVKYEVASFGTVIAAAATPDIAIEGGAHTVTGTTTITGFQTAPSGLLRVLHFETATPIVAGSALSMTNRTTAKGDVAFMRSLGSGNWKCEVYSQSGGGITAPLSLSSAAAGELLTLTSTEAGAGYGPGILLTRNSATPAVNDDIGRITWRGKDDGGNDVNYAQFAAAITDPTNGSEDANIVFGTMRAGTLNYWVWGSGAQYHAGLTKPTTAGALNARELQVNNSPAAGPVYIIQDQKSSGTNGGGITSGAWRTHTLNTEVLDEIGITTTTNVMALAAGTYKCSFWSTFSATDVSQCRLQDTTNTVTLAIGSNIKAGASNSGISFGHGYFVLSGAANVELQVRVSTTNGTDGGGQATSWGTEVYASVYLEKVA